MTAFSKNDLRINEILNQVKKISSGDYGGKLDLSRDMDEVDAISEELNQLGNSLQKREHVIKKKEERIQVLLDTLLRYTVLDFSERAPIQGEADEIDALAVGLNALGEEVIDHINKLKDSEQQIQTIFKNAPDAVVVINSDDVITRWNPAASRIFGWEEEEVVGKFLHEILVPERYRDKHLAGLRYFLKTGNGPVLNSTIEMPARTKNHSEIEIELTISPAKLNDSYLFISFLRDITERKKAAAQIRQLNETLEKRVLERTEQLNLSETKYRHLFQNNPMALWVLDIHTLKFLDVNESALKLYGYSRAEFLSMTSVDLRPEEEKPRYLQLNRNTRGTQITGIWKHCKKDGSIIHSEVIVHEIEFEGKPARLILANDVTEKINALRELQFSEARFRQIFESKMTGFLFWDGNGKITEANDLFLEMVGYTRSDLKEGRINLNKMTPLEYSETEKLALEQIRATGVCEPFEKEYIRKDGSRLPVIIGAADINDSPSVSGVTCVMDISQRKKMEQEILELNQDLETRISERTKALQEVNKELESFSYSVSHDLRAPLRAIHGYTQMLFEDYESKFDQEAMRLLDAIKFNAKRMGQLVDDLLAFSRMGKRALSERETDLTRLVKEIIDELVASTDKCRVKFTVHELGSARADNTLLRQAFQNLISNAVKYSSKKNNPEVEIGLKKVEGHPAWFVKDNGAGFDMAYYNKLFGVFHRLHEQEEFEGTGVGLAIVQRIIQRHGGKVWAEGIVGEGAVFYFTLGTLVAPEVERGS
jgi:PAS domain S-box-containing protein